MKLSIVTVGFGSFIIISASFMNQAWRYLEEVAGRDNLVISCAALFLAFAIFVLADTIKSRRGFLRYFALSVILSLVFLFAWQQPLFDERMHVLEYGLLGWLASRDLGKYRVSFPHIFFALLFLLFISVLDEAFQWFLPYRVCDIKDVAVNLVSGTFGIILFLLR